MIPAPKIDARSRQALADQTAELAAHFSRWRPAADGPDLGRSLVELFAGMAGEVLDRLNRVPDRDLLAFLDLIGVQRLPAQAARAPLTFTLADGQTDGLVPAATVVAAPAGGGADEALYEVERDLGL